MDNTVSQLIITWVTENPALVGTLKDGLLQMPFYESDKRKLTWHKFAASVQLVNKPKLEQDCWFILANEQDGTASVKFSKDGSRNKWKMHRVLYALLNKEALNIVNARDTTIHFAHRCGRGKATKQGLPVCVNPFHIKLATCQENQDDKGCKYGHFVLCPHSPKCIWTWSDTGLLKYCFNQPEFRECTCERLCSHSLSNEI